MVLAILFLRGQWITYADGTPILADFVLHYFAGQAALHGHAAAVYDFASFSRIQASAMHAQQGWYLWAYPPTSLLMVAPLSLAPYAASFVGWEFATLALLAWVAFAIVGRRSAAVLVLASPLSWLNVFVGQDGFVTGSLLGATLIWLERRPVLAGVALGALTYKPQFGLLFPVVLAATGQWRTIVAATATTAILAGAATAAFGVAVWQQFFDAMIEAGQYTFAIGAVAWGKTQTIYGLIRAADGSAGLAWAAQIAVSLAVTIVVCRFCRRPAPYALKAAILAAGALIITPYEFTYDLAAIAVPIAFLARDRIARGPAAGELAGVGAVVAGLFLVSPATPVLGSLPLGPVMLLALIWMALRRHDAVGAPP